MNKEMKLLIIGISICVFLLFFKFTYLDALKQTDELLPGVTDDPLLLEINETNPLHEYILGEEFTLRVSGFHIESRSRIFVTNDTSGSKLFNRIYHSATSKLMDRERADEDGEHGEYLGIYRNETHKLVVHIFEGERVEQNTGYHLVMTMYLMRVQ